MNVLVIDIGGTFIKYALMDDQMRILSRGKTPTPQDSAGSLTEAVGTIYDRICAQSGKPAGIAVSMPGIIDTERGQCIMGGALRYNDGVFLRDMLEERTGAAVHIDNDAKCAAMAEAKAGALQGVKDGIVMIFGTMVGGGIIKDGKLHRGTHFSAGEISFISTDRDTLPDWGVFYGNRCSVLRLCRDFALAKNLEESSVSGETVFSALEEGDEDAARCLDRFTREVAIQIFNLQNVLDPERFAIGGGISARSVFIESIRKNLDLIHEHFAYPLPRSEVVPCRFLNDANLYGAFQCFTESRAAMEP